MKVFNYILSFILTIGVIVYFVVLGTQSMKSTTISTKLDIKKLKSSEFLEYADNQKKKEETVLDIEEETEENTTDVEVEEEVEEEQEVVEESTTDETVEVSAPAPPVDTGPKVLEIQVGSLSGYGPDCLGCTGFLANGRDVRNGNIYYSDATYGTVRILAGDSKYPYGTIVRVKGSRLSEFVGIVLDRGGAVGFGKSHLFDLLFTSSSEAAKYEVSYNTTFEILRYGY